MASSTSSASEGEVIEDNKANRSTEFGSSEVDNRDRALALDGASDWDRDGYNSRKRRNPTRSPSPYRHKARSPSPSYRRGGKPDRSPSPYRHRHSRSPSPFQHDKASRGDQPKGYPQKRMASSNRHGRPEKRNFSDRGEGQREPARRGDRQHGGPKGHDSRDEHFKSRGEKGDKSDSNGYHRSATTVAPRPDTAGFADSADLAHRKRHTNGANTNGAVAAPKEEPDYTPSPAAEDTSVSEESREERRRRWAAKRAQLAATGNSPLLHHALLANASDVATPNAPSPALPQEEPSSPSHSSPRFSGMDSVPASPEVMVVDKEEGKGEGISPPGDGPSAANYDPTQDMLDDRDRAEQKAQLSGMSAAAYDETSPNQLSTLPAEKSGPAKKKKKEIDMFNFSDEGEDDDDGVEDDEDSGTAKGTVLDAKLLDNWDDTENYYKIISNELVNAGRYRIVKGLGRGISANVAQAEDMSKPGQLVAIKIVRSYDSLRTASQKEMDFLRRLNDSDPQDKKYMIRFLGSFDHKGHLCIVFEHMSKNLRDLLKEETGGHGLALSAVKTYARQMFYGLQHLQDCQIVHADLKPDNILVSLDKKTIKICDFGTAVDKRDNNETTQYFASRFYRAPEIILGMEIGYAVDMWAIGCTIFELWTGKILFNGSSNNQMIKVIMECIGWPTEKQLKKGTKSGDHFESGPPLTFLSKELDQFGNPISRRIEHQRLSGRALKARVFAATTQDQIGASTAQLNDFVDLLGATLNWNFEKRIQPKDAASHKFFKQPVPKPRSVVVKPQNLAKNNFGPRK